MNINLLNTWLKELYPNNTNPWINEFPIKFFRSSISNKLIEQISDKEEFSSIIKWLITNMIKTHPNINIKIIPIEDGIMFKGEVLD